MSTPAFLAQSESTITTPRYYTADDPYYYSVDNRPLTDLQSNIVSCAQYGADSARRASLIAQLSNSITWNDIYTGVGSVTDMFSGLGVSFPSTGTVQIGQGAVYEYEPVNTSLNTNIIKQGVLLTPVSLSAPVPTTAGQSVNSVVQYQLVDLTSTDMQTTPLPYMDSTNTYLPCLLLMKDLYVSIVAGAPATTGSQTTPSVTAGWSGLFVITSTYGAANPTVTRFTGGPNLINNDLMIYPSIPSSGGATTSTILGYPAFEFSKSSTQSVYFPIHLAKLNPYTPLRFKLTYSSDAASGNFAIQLNYAFVAIGGSTATSLTSTSVEAMSLGVSANAINTYTTEVAVVPNTVWATGSGGTWINNSGLLAVNFSRVPGNAADTNTGNLFIHKVIASQSQ